MATTAQRLADLFNEVLKVDPQAMQRLAHVRVPCGQALADHPTVIVRKEGDGYSVSLTGLLQGVCWPDGELLVRKHPVGAEANLLSFGVTNTPPEAE